MQLCRPPQNPHRRNTHTVLRIHRRRGLMGSRSGCCQLFAVVAIAAIFIPSVLAADYVVGDGAGWTTNFDYQAWAQGKVFFVGDKLIFNYKQGEHNVYKVNGTAFQRCAPPADVQPLTTGKDVIQLKTPGRKWYICGVGLHCDAGQKLVIAVLDQGAAVPVPSPSPLPKPSAQPPLMTNATNAPPPPPPPSAAAKAAVSGHVGLLVMAFGILAGIMIMA